LSCIVLAQLDALAAWDRRTHGGRRGLFGDTWGRSDHPVRPLDPLIGIAPWALNWMKWAMPHTHEDYRKKYIRFVIFAILVTLFFTLLELMQ
jgi:hypothetical protein